MEYAVLAWAYCTLLWVSAMGYVLDRKTEMTLQYTDLKLKYDNNDSDHSAVLTRSNRQNKTSPFAVAEAGGLENGDYDDNENDFIGTEDGTTAESSRVERNRRNTEECQEPNRDQLEAMLLSQLQANPIDADEENIGEGYLGHVECDTDNQNGAPLNRRTSCPWSNEEDYNETRHPSTIFYAKCNCTDCNNNGGSCQPVMKPQYVLYRDGCGADGVYQYNVRKVDVSVACVCSHFSNS